MHHKGHLLKVNVRQLREMVREEITVDHEIKDLALPEEVVDWLRGAMVLAQKHPLMAVINQHQPIDDGDIDSLDMVLCNQSDMMNVFEADENLLGMHNITNPDCDPFGEQSGEARTFRVIVPCDLETVNRHIAEAAVFMSLEEAALAWLATFTHELQHVRLFAENGAQNSPADLASIEEETGRDLFDISTGYGIRPLKIDGQLVWAESAQNAVELMEEHVEQCGREMAADIFQGEFAPVRFLELIGKLELEPRQSL